MKISNPLLQSCNILSGIGSLYLEKLQHLEIFNLHDLLYHLPFRYQDKTRITAIRDLNIQQSAVIQGIITESHWLKTRRPIYHVQLSDETGCVALRFFHMPNFQQRRLSLNTTLKVFGEVKLKAYGFELVHPEIEFITETEQSKVQDHFTPIYPSTHGIHQNQWRKFIQQLFNSHWDIINQLEWLDEDLLKQLKLPNLTHALKQLHFPSPEESCDSLINSLHPARRRVALEELLAYSISAQTLKKEQLQAKSQIYPDCAILAEKLLAELPFNLTQAQRRVLSEIKRDLNQSHPMLRLLQGDVGSGKTIVSALAALPILAQGHQVALMAPTDLLSEQHFMNLSKWLSPLGYQVYRLNRTTPNKEKKITLSLLAEGKAQLVVGTHALFQDKVEFLNLGLVMIDEQHRFGVVQRMKLSEKAKTHQAHQLFITATPIPRTLAMTQFSHFEISILDELPQGRKPIQTAVMPQDKRDEIVKRLDKTITNKGQIYWVCTRIEWDEEGEQQAAEAIASYLQSELPKARIALVHGKLKGLDKEKIMRSFKLGEFDILVATTVIEVGVDVPNANIMIIEDAEKLGLAQLHQLRGRVGRGQEDAYCILMYKPPLSLAGQTRLKIIRESNDGFYLAEEDMKLRGYGDVMGTQQSGFKDFKIAKIPDHYDLLKYANQYAKTLIQTTPHQADRLMDEWYAQADKYLKA